MLQCHSRMEEMWAKIQSSPLAHFTRLKRLQISFPLGMCVALHGVLGLTGGYKCAAIGSYLIAKGLAGTKIDNSLAEVWSRIWWVWS